jgi:hypothetical protein
MADYKISVETLEGEPAAYGTSERTTMYWALFIVSLNMLCDMISFISSCSP